MLLEIDRPVPIHLKGLTWIIIINTTVTLDNKYEHSQFTTSEVI